MGSKPWSPPERHCKIQRHAADCFDCARPGPVLHRRRLPPRRARVYTITGRVDDVINVSGHRVGTAEVEAALAAHGACIEAAVVGVGGRAFLWHSCTMCSGGIASVQPAGTCTEHMSWEPSLLASIPQVLMLASNFMLLQIVGDWLCAGRAAWSTRSRARACTRTWRCLRARSPARRCARA